MNEELLRELKETNARLYESMTAFQIAAEESGSLVFTYDTKKQAIFVDKHTAEKFGVTEYQPGVPYEMVKMGIVSEDTIEEYIRIHEAVINGAEEAGGVVKLIQADGSESIQNLKFRSIMDQDGNPTGMAVGIYRNVTERYIRERDQEKYRQFVYASDRYTFHYEEDIDTLTIFVSTGKDEDPERRYVLKAFSDRLATGEFSPREEILIVQELLRVGTKKPVQVRLTNLKTKELCWYSITANAVESVETGKTVYGIVSDISNLKSREEKYRKLECALNSMKDEYNVILEVDLEKDHYITLFVGDRMNVEYPQEGGLEEILWWMEDVLVAPEYKKQFHDFVQPSHLREALQEENRIELEYKMAGKEDSWRRCVYQLEEMKDGIPVKVIAYQSNIDKQKTLQLLEQQALREAYQYAESANKAKTDFLSRMSHDIRTPMNAIIGMTAIAGANLEQPAKVKECLNKITVASHHLLGLINEVLDMNKIESGAMALQKSEFNLSDLINNVITMMMDQIKEHGHDLQVHVERLSHEEVIGDSMRIEQIFVNLLSNAVKYTPDGGQIQLVVREHPAHHRKYGVYEFVFRDNGVGMSEEFQKVLFEPFTRAEESAAQVTGTGLGMTIARNLVRMMDGDIQVQSVPGEGTSFTVTIHLEIQDIEEKQYEQLEALPVLVVDDDPDACENVCLILEDIGMQGEWCTTGKQAVEMVRHRHTEEDDYFAVILDWKMPEMDGLETARKIRQTVGDDIPIIFLTAYDWTEIEEEAKKIGITKCLTKPIFKGRLLESFLELQNEEEEEPDTEMPSILSLAGNRILLAEDNELNAEIMKEVLEGFDIEMEWAHHGKEAVEMLKQSEENYYSLVFMDIQMPIMDGYEATKAMRTLDREDAQTIPIVAMTANAFVDDVSRALASGMCEHISKPIDFVKLEQILRKYLK